ncbi:hypothetical protein PI124_g18828 [Phytophthora idaei]|nr:hypothetical protein PI125_g19554 [Phytophthora idaei]KAG3135922.1 hypothetical protein PI126_g18035 [Phytophthora idaei]KAG3236159.1 hypothetical protein PI124_g18828 [Phytophthora idaei]
MQASTTTIGSLDLDRGSISNYSRVVQDNKSTVTFLDSETINADDEELPGIVLIALQDQTTLATYGWNNRSTIQGQ